MRKAVPYILVLLLSLTAGSASFAVEKKGLQTHTVINRGEFMAGAGILYADASSSNSEFLLLANGLDAEGKFFRIAPCMSWAYRDNASIGIRGSFTAGIAAIDNVNLNLLDKDLGIDIEDIGGSMKSFGVSLFHRNYFGLEKSGTVGLFCEFRLGYTGSHFDTGSNSVNSIRQARLSFAPGFILFVLPFVSMEASIGIADVTYTRSDAASGNAPVGNCSRIGGGISFNLLNSNFGITYHF